MFLMSSRVGFIGLVSLITASALCLGIYYRVDVTITQQAATKLAWFPVYDTAKKTRQENGTLHGTSKPRVMCMIFTTPGTFMRRGRAVERTWSRHCYRRRFFYSRQGDPNHPIANFSEAVALDVPEGRGHLTAKTMAALTYSYKNYANDTDWYMKADDDAYVLYNNLLLHLCRYDPSTPRYVGSTFRGTMGHLPKGYNSGGGGYLLSKESASKVLSEGITKFPQHCKVGSVGGWEDVDMGDCLRALSIFPEETRDSLKQLRFHPENPLRFIRGVLQETSDHGLEAYHNGQYNGVDFNGFNNTAGKERMLGEDPVTFHYVSPAEMFFIDYLVSLNKIDPNNANFCKKK